MLLRAAPRELPRPPDTPERVNKLAIRKDAGYCPGSILRGGSAAELAYQEAAFSPLDGFRTDQPQKKDRRSPLRTNKQEWAASGRIDGFALAYLGMKDDRLPAPPAHLVPRSAVAAYPTNFAAMARGDFEAIATRGEQLMRTVLPRYLHRAHC